MEKFLYVFSKNARDSLIKSNFTLLKSDEYNDVYVFANKQDGFDMIFDLSDISFILSDTLTF